MNKFFLIFLFLYAINSGANVSCLNNSEITLDKPLNRFLYERYFKQLFKYEPALIRENKISHLEVVSRQKIGDSLISSTVNYKISFRKDGRPIQMVEKNDYYGDSLITDYTYDSLDNLIECNVWKPEYFYDTAPRLVKSRSCFIYRGRNLLKVISFYNPTDSYYLKLNRFDSISTSLFESKFTIYYGQLTNSNIVVAANSVSLPKVKFNQFQKYNFIESSEMYFDDESRWDVECTFSDSILLKLQSITGKLCYSKAELRLIRRYGNFFNSNDIKEITINQFIDHDLFEVDTQLFVDTMEQKIYRYQNSFMSEPTSLENRNTSTNSVSIYDYTMCLVKVESVSERSRGQHEYNRDSSETTFTYFDFGLMKLKREVHYDVNRFRNEMDEHRNRRVWIIEEETVINKWEN